MLVGASICPHPPLLVRGVSAHEPDWLADLRAICVASVRRLSESGADRVVAVGVADRAGRWGEDAGGDVRRFGIEAGLARAGGPHAELPLSLTVAAGLLDGAAWVGRREYAAVRRGTSAAQCAAIGRDIVGGQDRVALLVMGDGSAKRTAASPGYLDVRAEGFDAQVVAALSAPAPETLLAVDPALADELWVAGREAWQVLAGAAGSGPAAGAPPIATKLRYDAAPVGVGYVVVDWSIGTDASEP